MNLQIIGKKLLSKLISYGGEKGDEDGEKSLLIPMAKLELWVKKTVNVFSEIVHWM